MHSSRPRTVSTSVTDLPVPLSSGTEPSSWRTRSRHLHVARSPSPTCTDVAANQRGLPSSHPPGRARSGFRRMPSNGLSQRLCKLRRTAPAARAEDLVHNSAPKHSSRAPDMRAQAPQRRPGLDGGLHARSARKVCTQGLHARSARKVCTQGLHAVRTHSPGCSPRRGSHPHPVLTAVLPAPRCSSSEAVIDERLALPRASTERRAAAKSAPLEIPAQYASRCRSLTTAAERRPCADFSPDHSRRVRTGDAVPGLLGV